MKVQAKASSAAMPIANITGSYSAAPVAVLDNRPKPIQMPTSSRKAIRAKRKTSARDCRHGA